MKAIIIIYRLHHRDVDKVSIYVELLIQLL